MFFTFVTTSLVLTQVRSEWVEISQQHYQKPIRTTHNHPLLATIATDVDKGKGNRIYLNHSLQEHTWNTGPINKVPSGNANRIKLQSSDVNIKKNNGVGDKKHTESNVINELGVNSRGDASIVRKPYPDETKSVNIANGHRSTVAGNVIAVRPIGTEPSRKIKPFDDFTEHVEVLNLSDITSTGEEQSTEYFEEIFTNGKVNRRQNSASNTTPVGNNRETDISLHTDLPSRTTALPNENIKLGPKGSAQTNKQDLLLLSKNNMRRVEIIRNKPPSITQFEEDRRLSRPPVTSKPNIDSDADTEKTTTYKLPLKGEIKRVHNVNNTLKINKYSSPELPFEEHSLKDDPNQIHRIDKTTVPQRVAAEKVSINTDKSENSRFKNYELINTHNRNPEDIMIEEILNEVKGVKVHKVSNIGTVKRVSPTEIAKINRRNDGPKLATEVTPEFETDGDVFVEEEDSNDAYNQANNKGSSSGKPTQTTTKPKPKIKVTKKPKISTQIEEYEKGNHRPARPSHEPIPEFVTKDEDFDVTTQFIDDFKLTTETTIKMQATAETFQRTTKYKANLYNDEEPTSNTNVKDSKPQVNNSMKHEAKEEDTVSDDSKTSSMENLIKFLKTVTDIITKNTRRGVQGKMRYLEDLRDTILANIEERIEAAFPDDDASSKRRSRSTARSEPRGHVEFPSSESALMTISFLTFAVFLIKLVLQVIQAYKNKTMMVVPTMVAAVGRTFSQQKSQK